MFVLMVTLLASTSIVTRADEPTMNFSGEIRVIRQRHFSSSFHARMLKFSRARFCAERRVFASGRAPHAGSFRAAAPQLGAPRSHPRSLHIFLFGPHRAQGAAKTP